MSYTTRYPNEPDESFDQFDITVEQVEDVEIDKPIDNIHLEVRNSLMGKRIQSL
jgi:hypothetical protein